MSRISYLLLFTSMLYVSTAAGDVGERKEFRSGKARVALLELFSSEGCSSCPAAERAVYHLRREPGLFRTFVPMVFHVSYWNDLGWVDRMADDRYTARQHAYASEWGAPNVYTPAFVLNGVASHSPLMPIPRRESDEIAGEIVLHAAYGKQIDLLFIPATQPKGELSAQIALLGNDIESFVTSGENKGSSLRHNFVVLGIESVSLVKDAASTNFAGTLSWIKPKEVGAKGFSIAAWITELGSQKPLQVVGGDL